MVLDNSEEVPDSEVDSIEPPLDKEEIKIEKEEVVHLLIHHDGVVYPKDKVLPYSFHIISIIFVCLSVIIPLFEIIPMILILYLKKYILYSTKTEKVLHRIDFNITIAILVLLATLYLILGILTCGTTSILFILLIPHVIVIFQLDEIKGRGPVLEAYGFV